jgi:hypothetical protein
MGVQPADEAMADALRRARAEVCAGCIGEDIHGQLWVQLVDGWSRLDRLMVAEDVHGPRTFTWMEMAVQALDLSGEVGGKRMKIYNPQNPGSSLWLLRLV